MAEGRHELKHRISYADCLELRARLPHVARPDDAAPGGLYRVRSLYFDNYDDRALRQKLDGVDEREKFRLRLYNGQTDLIRLEKKRKSHGLCYKDSAFVSPALCRAILAGDYRALLADRQPLLHEFFAKIRFGLLRPKNIVDYRREAYVFRAGNVRVTMDSDLRVSTNTGAFLDSEIVFTSLPGAILLEVKYDHFLPELIRGLTSLSSRQATAFSKYAMARLV